LFGPVKQTALQVMDVSWAMYWGRADRIWASIMAAPVSLLLILAVRGDETVSFTFGLTAAGAFLIGSLVGLFARRLWVKYKRQAT